MDVALDRTRTANTPSRVKDFTVAGAEVRLDKNDAVVFAGDPAGDAWCRSATTSDHWRAGSPRILEIVDGLAAGIDAFGYGPQDSTDIDVDTVAGVEIYGAQQTLEHDDRGFARWTALLVVNTDGHTIDVDDLTRTIMPAVGDIVLFDLHRVHVLDMSDQAELIEPPARPPPRALFMCAHLDFDFENLPDGAVPSRALVETMLERYLDLTYRPAPSPDVAPAP